MVAFTLFGLKIYRYGIFYFVSFILGYLYLSYVSRTPKVQNEPTLKHFFQGGVDDLIFYLVIGVLIGGRFGYVFFYDPIYYIHNPLKVFYVREGGMSFVGGTLGVILGVLYLKNKYKINKTSFLKLFDIILSYLPFGLMLGRIGNYLNQELYGRLVSDFFPSLNSSIINMFLRLNFFHIYPSIDHNIRVNSNFFEAFFEGFVLLSIMQFVFWKGNLKPGVQGALFLIFYGVFRFFAEFLRYYPMDQYFYGLNLSQFFMIFFIIGGIILFFYFSKTDIKTK